MTVCPFDLMERLQEALDELQTTLSECDAEEPLSVRHCIVEWRATMESGQRAIHHYYRGKPSDLDDDG